MHLLFLALIRW